MANLTWHLSVALAHLTFFGCFSFYRHSTSWTFQRFSSSSWTSSVASVGLLLFQQRPAFPREPSATLKTWSHLSTVLFIATLPSWISQPSNFSSWVSWTALAWSRQKCSSDMIWAEVNTLHRLNCGTEDLIWTVLSPIHLHSPFMNLSAVLFLLIGFFKSSCLQLGHDFNRGQHSPQTQLWHSAQLNTCSGLSMQTMQSVGFRAPTVSSSDLGSRSDERSLYSSLSSSVNWTSFL